MDSSRKVFDKKFGRKWNVGICVGQFFAGGSMLLIAAVFYREGALIVSRKTLLALMMLFFWVLFFLTELVCYYCQWNIAKKQKQYIARDGSLHFELHPGKHRTVRYYFPDGWTAELQNRYVLIRGNGVLITVFDDCKLKERKPDTDGQRRALKHRSENIPSAQIPLVFTGVNRLLRGK